MTTQAEPINLLNEVYPGQIADIRAKFTEFKAKQKFIANANYKHDLRTGDIILFKNGYDVEMTTEILGFDEEGKAYLLWDCYWYTIDLNERLIKKIS